jgi:hypothetical protein
MFSQPLTTAATFLACPFLSLSQPPRVARVFYLYILKETPQPLNVNLDQWLIRVGLLGLMLGCRHTSMWRDMAKQKLLDFYKHINMALSFTINDVFLDTNNVLNTEP